MQLCESRCRRKICPGLFPGKQPERSADTDSSRPLKLFSSWGEAAPGSLVPCVGDRICNPLQSRCTDPQVRGFVNLSRCIRVMMKVRCLRLRLRKPFVVAKGGFVCVMVSVPWITKNVWETCLQKRQQRILRRDPKFKRLQPYNSF